MFKYRQDRLARAYDQHEEKVFIRLDRDLIGFVRSLCTEGFERVLYKPIVPIGDYLRSTNLS